MPAFDDFAGRVNYAAKVISEGRGQTRTFESCLEMFDGKEVGVALFRRSLKNQKLAANLTRYLCAKWLADAVADLATVPTHKLAAHAAETRRKENAYWDEYFAKLNAEREAQPA